MPASRLVLKYEGETRTSANGQEALQESLPEGLVTKYNKVMDEVVRTTMRWLVNSAGIPGEVRRLLHGEDSRTV